MKFYLIAKDNAAGSPSTLKSFQLLDLTYSLQTNATTLPATADASTLLSAVVYDVTTGDIPPTAQMTATPTAGYLPLTVAFDASTSTDADGTIASYDWNFGDSALGSGIAVSHTYTVAGTFTATLTVTDNKGAKSTKSVTIAVTDPNVLTSPSSLTASAVVGGARLKWVDNSGSETGFVIERAPQGQRGFIGAFVQVATTAANATTYTDSVKSGTYYYRVKAVNAATGKSSAYSNTASVKVR
jgi:PKD repeat protein